MSSLLKSTRHGFSSFLKYGNSPYLGHNGLYAPTNPPAQLDNMLVSKYTSDGVIPYPFIQPGLTGGGLNNAVVTVDWAAAEYTSGKNINDLVCMFPEEELHELRTAIGVLPAGWALYPSNSGKTFTKTTTCESTRWRTANTSSGSSPSRTRPPRTCSETW